MNPEYISKWRPLFWQGVLLKVEVGITLRKLLTCGLGINRQFVDERIRTVFLNGHPLDDIKSAFVDDGAHVALGGALPGIVGIAMQRQSPVRFIRHNINFRSEDVPIKLKIGEVTMKLFNEIAVALDRVILRRGIIVEVGTLLGYLNEPEGILRVELSGKVSTLTVVKQQLSEYEYTSSKSVLLEVVSSDTHDR